MTWRALIVFKKIINKSHIFCSIQPTAHQENAEALESEEMTTTNISYTHSLLTDYLHPQTVPNQSHLWKSNTNQEPVTKNNRTALSLIHPNTIFLDPPCRLMTGSLLNSRAILPPEIIKLNSAGYTTKRQKTHPDSGPTTPVSLYPTFSVGDCTF